MHEMNFQVAGDFAVALKMNEQIDFWLRRSDSWAPLSLQAKITIFHLEKFFAGATLNFVICVLKFVMDRWVLFNRIDANTVKYKIKDSSINQSSSQNSMLKLIQSLPSQDEAIYLNFPSYWRNYFIWVIDLSSLCLIYWAFLPILITLSNSLQRRRRREEKPSRVPPRKCH